MPNRVLRDWTKSEKVDKLSAKAEVFFTRLIMKADDFGYYSANVKILKSDLYPLRENMRSSEITPLLKECQECDLLGTYTVAGKEYLLIKDFGQRLRTMQSKFPKPTDDWLRAFYENGSVPPSNDSSTPPETEEEEETRNRRRNTPNGVVVATLPTDDTQKILLSKWDEILKSFEGKSIKDIRITIEDFIKSDKPKFIDPYMNYWNILADYLKLAKVQACTDARKNKFKVRINEPAFDFIKILDKIRCSPMLKGETSNWRVSFDWIFENQSNYVKILEGTYDA